MKRSMLNVVVLILVSALVSACSDGGKKKPVKVPDKQTFAYTTNVGSHYTLYLTDGTEQGSIKLDTDLTSRNFIEYNAAYFYTKSRNESSHVDLIKNLGSPDKSEVVAELPTAIQDKTMGAYAIVDETLYVAFTNNQSKSNIWYVENGTFKQLTDFDFNQAEYGSTSVILVRGSNIYFTNKGKLFRINHADKSYELQESLDDYYFHIQDVGADNGVVYLVAYNNDSHRLFSIDKDGELTDLNNTPVSASYPTLYQLDDQLLVVTYTNGIRYFDTDDVFSDLNLHDFVVDSISNSLFINNGSAHYIVNSTHTTPFKLFDIESPYYHATLAWNDYAWIEDPSYLIITDLNSGNQVINTSSHSSAACVSLSQTLIAAINDKLLFHKDDQLYVSQGPVLVDDEYQIDCQLLKDFSASEPEA